jgi:hypothetical protein
MLSAAFNSIEDFDDGSNTPKHFKDDLGHKNQAKWWESMKKGFPCYGKQRSVEYNSVSSKPHGRKLIFIRWVYIEKDDGTYRSRTVAHSLSQVSGKDLN